MVKFNENCFDVFNKDWAIVTSGTKDHYNSMTISWGGLGTLWNKPVCTVYIKPCRYTHDFMEANDTFTVSFYKDEYKKIMGNVFGNTCGKDTDKVKESGFTPVIMENGITYKEAEVTLVCKKLYHQDLDVSAMPEFAIAKYYTEEAPHTMYIGEVVEVIK